MCVVFVVVVFSCRSLRGLLSPLHFRGGAPPHSRVVAAHGEQEAAEQPHVGVEPGGRHLPHMIHDAHGGGEAKRSGEIGENRR